MTESQKAVLTVLNEYGPMHDAALVPLAQHMADVAMSSSSIRSRRSELAEFGFVTAVGGHRMPSGRTAIVWKAA